MCVAMEKYLDLFSWKTDGKTWTDVDFYVFAPTSNITQPSIKLGQSSLVTREDYIDR